MHPSLGPSCILIRASTLISFGVTGCPSDSLALSNCLIVHPADFQQGQHVLVKGAFPLTTRRVSHTLSTHLY
jgi:hypothetical protein